MDTIKERKKCTKCGRGELDTRVPRGVLVKTFLFWLPIKRYRCNICWGKTYVYGSVFEEHEVKLSEMV